MAVITFNGLLGGGGPVIGAEVARTLGIDYVDRHIISEAAGHIGATVEALVEKEQRRRTLGDRLARFFQNVLERSVAAGTGGDPYFGPGLETLLGKSYAELPQEPLTRAQEIDDEHFFEVTRDIILDLARAGNVVIIGRGSNVVLMDAPGVLHVGHTAPFEKRVEVIMRQEGLDREAADKSVTDNDKARFAYYKKHFGVDHPNPRDYHMILNTGRMDFQAAAKIVVHAVQQLNF